MSSRRLHFTAASVDSWTNDLPGALQRAVDALSGRNLQDAKSELIIDTMTLHTVMLLFPRLDHEYRAGIFWFDYTRWLLGIPEEWDPTPEEIRERLLHIIDHLGDALAR